MLLLLLLSFVEEKELADYCFKKLNACIFYLQFSVLNKNSNHDDDYDHNDNDNSYEYK